MSIPSDKTSPDKFVSLRQLGSTGWNALDDAQDQKDTDLSDVLNVTYDNGFPSPRGGSVLAFDVPTGETNALLNLFAARASDGTNYSIGVYAPNFYLWDDTNLQWVKINSTYTPSSTYNLLPYGYKNWNAGVSKDYLYCGNGKEDTIQWKMEVGYVATLATAGSTSITLTDSTKFGSSGTIVIKAPGGSEVYTTYSANSANVLTVPSLGANVVAGSIIASQIADASSFPKGRLFNTFNGRLLISNFVGGESTLSGSKVGDATTWTPNTGASDPFVEVITDGNGGITGLDDFGSYLIIEKANAMFQLSITVTSDSSGASYKTVNVTPVVDGVSSGVLQPFAKIKYGNILYFVTPHEGIRGADPTSTGTITSVFELFISRPINPFVKKLDFTNTKTVAFDQKIFFSCTNNTLADTVLVFDLLRSKVRKGLYEYDSVYVWTKFNNWPVKDWLIHNDELYFGSRVDNKVYRCLTDAKIDGQTPYEARALTKAFDFGQGAMPKTMGRMFVSGYISPQENLMFDLTLITGNGIINLPYQLSGNGNFTVLSIPKALAMSVLGDFDYGMEMFDAVTGIFRAYLAIPARYGFYTIQMGVHSSVNGTDWGLTGIGFEPWQEVRYPAAMEMGVIGDTGTSVTIAQQFVSGGSSASSPVLIHFVDNEVPAGSGASFTISVAPNPLSSLMLTRDGELQEAGGVDYTLSGNVITLNTALVSGEKLLASYRY